MNGDKIIQVHYTPKYFKSFKKISHEIQETAKEKDKLFRRNPFDYRLHTHKLKGQLLGVWSYSVL